MPDDDYFCEDTMRKHVTLLDERPDAVGAFGHAASFLPVSKQDGTPHFVQVRIKPEDKPDNDTFTDPIQRIFYAFFEKSRSSYYSLYRTDVYLRSVIAAKRGSVLNDADHVDSNYFYLGDAILTALPLIVGNKINTGLPMVAFQIGNSVGVNLPEPSESLSSPRRETVDHSKKSDRNNTGPTAIMQTRQPHHMLPLLPEFQFAKRAEMFISTLTEEYEAVQQTAKPQVLDRFFRELLMCWIGSIGMGGGYATSAFNRTRKNLALGPDGHVSVRNSGIMKHDIVEIDGPRDVCKICEAGGSVLCDDIKLQYGFFLNELININGASSFQLREEDWLEIELAKALYSRTRPTYGTS